ELLPRHRARGLWLQSGGPRAGDQDRAATRRRACTAWRLARMLRRFGARALASQRHFHLVERARSDLAAATLPGSDRELVTGFREERDGQAARAGRTSPRRPLKSVYGDSAFSVARSSGAALTGEPVAFVIHTSGVTEPYLAIRSNSGPSTPAFFTCS